MIGKMTTSTTATKICRSAVGQGTISTDLHYLDQSQKMPTKLAVKQLQKGLSNK